MSETESRRSEMSWVRSRLGALREEFAGEEDEDGTGDEDGEAGAVVNAVDGIGAVAASGDGEGEGTESIADEGGGESEEEEENAARSGETEEFPDGEGDHDVALERADAAAGFFDAEKAAGDGDEVAALFGGVAHPLQGFDDEAGVAQHEPGHDGVFLRARPRDRDEEEEDGKGEVSQPRCAAEEIDDRECHNNSAHGGEGGDHAPVGVGEEDGLQGGQQESGEGEKAEGGDFSSGGYRCGRRAVRPAAGEKKNRKNRDEGAVAVLGVERPFPPIGAEDEEPREREGGNPPPKGGRERAVGGGGRHGKTIRAET